MRCYKLSHDEIIKFQNIGIMKHFQAGGILFYENDSADTFYIILEGLVKGGRFEPKREKIYHYFFPSTMIGEVSFLESGTYPLSSKFVTKGTVICITKTALAQYEDFNNSLIVIFQKAIIGKVRDLQNSLNIITSVNYRVRTAIFLLEHKNWLSYISITEMASVLNLTRESSSRAISFFVQAQYVKKIKNKLIIIDENSLREYIKQQECDINHI